MSDKVRPERIEQTSGAWGLNEKIKTSDAWVKMWGWMEDWC